MKSDRSNFAIFKHSTSLFSKKRIKIKKSQIENRFKPFSKKLPWKKKSWLRPYIYIYIYIYIVVMEYTTPVLSHVE